MNKKITFEDNGQDFLIFEATPEGKIVDVQPFQWSVWSKYKITNMNKLSEGGFVDLVKVQSINKGNEMTIKYPIEKIENVKPKTKQTMKTKMLFIAAMFSACTAMAQITLEHTYPVTTPSPLSTSKVDSSTWVYYHVQGNDLKVYDASHSNIKTIPIPAVSGFQPVNCSYVTKTLFDLASSDWEYAVAMSSTMGNPGITVIFDESGTQLLRIDSCNTITVVNMGAGGTKMIAPNTYGSTYNRTTKVYSLAGTVNVGKNEIPEAMMLAYPNPASEQVSLKYSLPAGADQARMIIANNQGQVIKEYSVDNTFPDILINTSEWANGMYFYYISSGNYKSTSEKFIITK